MKILIADPNRDLLEAYRHLLTIRGQEADCAFDGPQAVGAMTEKEYGLLILGERIPRISPDRILSYARERGVKTILLRDQVRTKEGSAGTSGHEGLSDAQLSFPFLPGELYTLIDGLSASVKEEDHG